MNKKLIYFVRDMNHDIDNSQTSLHFTSIQLSNLYFQFCSNRGKPSTELVSLQLIKLILLRVCKTKYLDKKLKLV
uniref:CSON002484 protein n=1 Tax=Culicoides sonorensis TaxID=179676 RepID=A0A336MQ78_CULSO